MSDVPATEADNIVEAVQSDYECLAENLRPHYPDSFPKDVRDFRPQPWLLPVAYRKDNLSLYQMHRSFGVLPIEQPPPLEKDTPVEHFSRVLHHEDAPSWNHPEVIWGGLQALNLSTPLAVPPSIIFWSIEHHLPVYLHTHFLEASRKGPYAHPYASSEYVFSDESAARYRAELGLSPLEDPCPLRPLAALR